MVFHLLKSKITGNISAADENDSACILILEDDPDQMEMLTSYGLNELQKLVDSKNTSEENKVKLAKVKIISASSIEGLSKATAKHTKVLLALLDGNTPNEKGEAPHDQFIKNNHQITGKHRAVEIVKNSLPGTPITMISTLDRFKKIVFNHYNTKHELNINFISKNDQDIIRKNIAYYLRQYLKKEE